MGGAGQHAPNSGAQVYPTGQDPQEDTGGVFVPGHVASWTRIIFGACVVGVAVVVTETKTTGQHPTDGWQVYSKNRLNRAVNSKIRGGHGIEQEEIG